MNINKFNSMYATPASKELIRKAMLTSATNVAEGTIPEHLADVITNTAVRLVPELAIPTLKYDPQKFHSFNRLNSLPAAGSAMGEASTTPIRRSATSRASVQLKVMKRKGAVTGFLKSASKEYLDQPAAEMENHVLSFANDYRTYLLYGNKDADAYTFDGLDKFIATNRTNLGASSQVQTNLSVLDGMIDANTRRQGQPHRKVFMMSPELLSQLSGLWTQVRDNRPASRIGTSDILVSGGYRLETYRGIPILETSGTRPVTDMGVVTTASAGTGGAIDDDEYFFRVAPVTWDGEQGACAEVSETTSNADTLTLSFAAVENALYYKVYCGLTTGVANTTLKKIVSAFTYDGDGTVSSTAVTSIVFSSNPSTADASSVPTHMQSDLPLTRTATVPMESVILWDLDEFQGMGKIAYTNDAGSRFRGLITPMELAQTDDNYPFLLKSYSGLIDSFEATSFLVRGFRTA